MGTILATRLPVDFSRALKTFEKAPLDETEIREAMIDKRRKTYSPILSSNSKSSRPS